MQYTRASLHHANAELRHRRGRSRSNPVQVKQHILEVTNWMFSKSGVLPIDACPPNLSSELIKRSYQVILSSDQELIKSLSSTYWALNFLLSLSLNHNLSLKLRGLINNWNCFSDRMQPKNEWRSHRLCVQDWSTLKSIRRAFSTAIIDKAPFGYPLWRFQRLCRLPNPLLAASDERLQSGSAANLVPFVSVTDQFH